MKNRILKLLLIIFLGIAAISVFAKEATTRILILNSYHHGLPWTDSLNDGFTATITKSLNDVNFFIEYLDTKRNKSSISEEQRNYVAWRIKEVRPHIIATTDDDAFQLMKKLITTERGFDTIPVIFMGVNREQDVPKNFTGIFEKVDIKSNFRLIKQLKPDTRKVYCILDRTTTGQLLRKQLDSLLLTFYPDFDVEVLWDYASDELFERVSKLGENEAILFLLFNKDKNDHYYSNEQILDSISHYTPAPIFGISSLYLNHGIIGGDIISGYHHGKRAAEMALLIITGVSPKTVNPSTGPSYVILDYKQIGKYQIDKNQIPAGTSLINKPIQRSANERITFYHVIFIILFFSVIIIFLVILFRIKQKNKRFQEYYKTILEQKNKEIEESLKIAENANRLKTAFLANMSHEIRTPMNSIIGFSNIIKDGPNLSPEEVHGFLEIINDNAKQLLNLINNIIDISKIDSQQLTLYNRPVQLGSIFANCYRAAEVERDRLGKNSILIEMSFSPTDAACEVVTDPDRLNQVVMNLLGNAIKFTDRGKIIVRYALIQDLLSVSVEDTGIGLKVDDVNKIFERFTQLDGTLTREFGGSGLGLSICKGIVETMGGRIGVESNPGKGSKFWFELPVRFPKEGESSVETAAQPTKSKLKNKILLIVEDNEPSALLLREMLKGTGAVIVHASTGKEVLKILKDKVKVDIALVDIYLPDLSGFELVSAIKKIQPHVKIIVQTANAIDSDRDKAINAGCNGYITKPIEKDELLSIINKLF